MKPIYVTQPHLPSLNELIPLLEDIWDTKVITNIGKYHKELEISLAEYLKVPYVSLFSNGTLALITALQTLRISGEVITTPYSFAATCHALYWNNIVPVFVDIEPGTCNINPRLIEEAITPATKAVMPVHVYGQPCQNDAIQKICDIYGLKLIYDAAHAFGVEENGTSVLNYGDLSVLSFHATKVFNTIEGGAIISHDIKTKTRIDYLKNFGFADEITVVAPGINGKMNEIQAAYGLIQLKSIDTLIEKRKRISDIYVERLSNIAGISMFQRRSEIKYNYSYFPILINREEFGFSRDYVYDYLKKFNIFSRRYFYPSLSNIAPYKGLPSAAVNKLPIANQIAEDVLCLPIFPDMTDEQLEYIIEAVKNIK